MSALENITGEFKTPRNAMAFIGNVIAALGLLVIGCPLAAVTIRTMLLGWFMIVVDAMQSIFGRHSYARESQVTLRTVPIRSTECRRYR